MQYLKAQFVNTRIGRVAKSVRASIEQITSNLETVGTIANDRLAEFLVTRLAQRHFVDVGCHIGSIISEVQIHCPNVKITAVEPIPEKARRLKRNFPAVQIIETALSDREGEASFYVHPTASGYSSLADSEGKVEIPTKLARLDSLVSDPDVVKIDVEGGELGVLRGAEKLKSRPIYLFESAPGEILGYTKVGLWEWFESQSYGIFLPNRLAHKAPPMSLELFLDSHEFPRRTTNYFAVPLEDRDAVLQRAAKLLR